VKIFNSGSMLADENESKKKVVSLHRKKQVKEYALSSVNFST